jgi:hypothetical protein
LCSPLRSAARFSTIAATNPAERHFASGGSLTLRNGMSRLLSLSAAYLLALATFALAYSSLPL